jgi:hypothetical protein
VNEVGHVAQPGERGKEFPRKEGVDEAWNQCYEIGHILPKKKNWAISIQNTDFYDKN